MCNKYDESYFKNFYINLTSPSKKQMICDHLIILLKENALFWWGAWWIGFCSGNWWLLAIYIIGGAIINAFQNEWLKEMGKNA